MSCILQEESPEFFSGSCAVSAHSELLAVFEQFFSELHRIIAVPAFGKGIAVQIAENIPAVLIKAARQ